MQPKGRVILSVIIITATVITAAAKTGLGKHGLRIQNEYENGTHIGEYHYNKSLEEEGKEFDELTIGEHNNGTSKTLNDTEYGNPQTSSYRVLNSTQDIFDMLEHIGLGLQEIEEDLKKIPGHKRFPGDIDIDESDTSFDISHFFSSDDGSYMKWVALIVIFSAVFILMGIQIWLSKCRTPQLDEQFLLNRRSGASNIEQWRRRLNRFGKQIRSFLGHRGTYIVNSARPWQSVSHVEVEDDKNNSISEVALQRQNNIRTRRQKVWASELKREETAFSEIEQPVEGTAFSKIEQPASSPSSNTEDPFAGFSMNSLEGAAQLALEENTGDASEKAPFFKEHNSPSA